MKKLFGCFILCVTFLAQPIVGEQKEFTLDDFVSKGTFSHSTIGDIKPMNNGDYYSKLEEGGTLISRYEYSSGERSNVIIDVAMLDGVDLESVDGYVFSDDESRALIWNNRKQIYRRSYSADYYIVDVQREEVEPLSEHGGEMVPLFSPDGHRVAYVRDNNIYIYNVRFKSTTQVTDDGEKDYIINGLADWVYEEEFYLTRAFDWSPDSRDLAFIRFDESQVNSYSFPLYQGSNPSNDQYELYPGSYTYKYPKAGEDNSKVLVHVFNLHNRTTKEMDLDTKDKYVPLIKWTTNPSKLAVLILNRRQNRLDLNIVNPASGVSRTLFTDKNDRYISSSSLQNFHFIDGDRYFIYVGELDGYNHIHLFGMDGIHRHNITKGEWDVTSFLGYDKDNEVVYFQAAKESPLTREVYSVSLDGNDLKQLSDKGHTGHATASFSSDYSYYIMEQSSVSAPPVYNVYDSRRNRLRAVLADNKELSKKVGEYNLQEKEFFTFNIDEGTELNGWMLTPPDFDSSREYPLVMIQYSGPNTQQVLNRWGVGWEQYLINRGYVVVSVDGRGTGARGEDFRKQTYMQMGKLESDDQISAAKYLSSLSYIDESNIAIWGWSYGGFVTALSMSKSDMFKAGIAVAPVTHWKYYDTGYTERLMRRPQENPSGYSNNAPINMVDDLSGRLFLIHGTADDNVHFQNVAEYADRLIEAGKQFDMFVYPNHDHSISAGNARSHLYRMKVNFLDNYLK
ncbi:S9 family peptidase [Marinilabiliaceae bacterium ANBcel2]|nr:S9 family peptidase [Marinilabiliaceae bacterium ANBcel2]